MPSEGKQHKDFKKAHPEAVVKLLSPDGYYTYLGVTRPKPTESDPNPPIDEETVKKSYRRLSLRHHPDRPTGDDETFRVLNRAQKVLLNPKLRQQYDLLGLDLDDEDEEHHHDEDHTTEGDDEGKEGDDSSGNGGSSSNSNGSPEGIVSQLASVTLASIFQIVVRTGV
jgi:curved DNA-binding protein CbpA